LWKAPWPGLWLLGCRTSACVPLGPGAWPRHCRPAQWKQGMPCYLGAADLLAKACEDGERASFEILGVHRQGGRLDLLTGFSAEEALRRHIVEDFAASKCKAWSDGPLAKDCAGEEPACFEFQGVRRQGGHFDLLLRLAPVAAPTAPWPERPARARTSRTCARPWRRQRGP